MAAPRFWLASSSKRPRCKAVVTSFVAARAGQASRQRAAQRSMAKSKLAPFDGEIVVFITVCLINFAPSLTDSPQQVECPPHHRQRRVTVEEPHLAQRVSLPARHRQPVRERKLPIAVFEVWRQFGDLAMEFQCLRRLAARGQFEPGRVPPTRQPMQQLHVRQHHPVLPVAAAGMRLRQPLNEFPIAGWKELLLMRRPRRQLDDVCQRAHLLARARAKQVKLNGQAVSRWLLLIELRPANRAQEGAGGIEVRGLGREEPRFQLPDELLLLRRTLDLGEAVQVGVSAQLRRQRTLRPQKQEGQLFEPPLSLRRQQPRPPVRAWEVLARERKLLEVILQ